MEVLLYSLAIIFIISPLLWLVGVFMVPFILLDYFLLAAIIWKMSFVSRSVKALNTVVVGILAVTGTGLSVWVAACQPGACGPAGVVTIAPFLITLPAVAFLAYLNGRAYKAAMGQVSYASQIELAEEEMQSPFNSRRK